jgi:hypothetical protein
MAFKNGNRHTSFSGGGIIIVEDELSVIAGLGAVA